MGRKKALQSRPLFCLCVAGWLVQLATPVHAQTIKNQETIIDTSKSFECTDVTIDYANDPSLTREERLHLMDQALYHSLGQFDACQAQRTGASAENAAAGSAGSGTAGGTGTSGDSVASTDMSGDETSASGEATAGEAAMVTPSEATSTSGWPNPDAGQQPEEAADGAELGGNPVAHDNGKVPDDIPPADNDSILEAQIRQAAMRESDPETKAKLWDEYRKYKGLPAVQ